MAREALPRARPVASLRNPMNNPFAEALALHHRGQIEAAAARYAEALRRIQYPSDTAGSTPAVRASIAPFEHWPPLTSRSAR
jgi:hypothetical protein